MARQSLLALLVSSATLAIALSCGTSRPKGTSVSASACNNSLTFANDIQPIVAPGGTAGCAGCHNQYGSLQGFQNSNGEALRMIQSGRMPEGNPGFNQTSEGQKMMSWLACGPNQ